MSRAVAYRHADWLSLVDPTGSFVTIPVLNRAFPAGVERNDPATRASVREHLPEDFGDPAVVTQWIEWVLGDLLGWGKRLRSGPQIPETLTHVVGEHHTVLRPDYSLSEPTEAGERVRAIVCTWPSDTVLTVKAPTDRWAASPVERMSTLCRASGVALGLVTNGREWHVVWAPRDEPPGGARFVASLFSEESTLLDAFVSLLGAKRFFAVAPKDTIEALLAESATAQEVVADQLGRQVRQAVELLIAAIGRANRDRGGSLLHDTSSEDLYNAAVTVMMRLVFLLFAEERGLLPVDDEFYASAYAVTTMREEMQAEQDLLGDEPLERRSSAWNRLLALFRAVHGGITHDNLRVPPYGGGLFDPDRFPFLEGRPAGSWHGIESHPIPVDDLTVLAILTQLQVLEFNEGGVREARQLSYRTLEVEQIGHVYEGLLDHSVRKVDATMLGLVGKAGQEPEIELTALEAQHVLGRDSLIAWLKGETGKTQKQLEKLLDGEPSDVDVQLLKVAVEHDIALFDRVLPYVGLLRRDLRDLPIVLLGGSIVVTQTSTRRDGGIEYTTRALADEVAQYALEPLVYSPGPQDTDDASEWRLRPSAKIAALKVCDPAVGSGSILVAAGRFLADRLVEAWQAEGAEQASGDPEEVRVAARRVIADRCLYGVDRDPLAVEMAKLSLWLTTMSKDRPFTFLDHAIRAGDALLGVTDIDQVRWMHLDPTAGQKLHSTLFDYVGVLEPLVKGALERRRRLSAIEVMTIRDAEDKARLTAEADVDLEALRAVADLVVAAAVNTSTQKASAYGNRLLAAAQSVSKAFTGGINEEDVAALRAQAHAWLNSQKPADAPTRACLHWPLEFPEVFLDRERPGFDAMVGNPPFLGGQRITAAMGEDMRNHAVRWTANGATGSADLVAYFFLRASELSKEFGFLATNTVAQGDTSKVGLSQILDGGWTIHRAVSSTPWPGRASLEISKVWITSDVWAGSSVLDGHGVPAGIDEMLYRKPRSGWRKQRLVSNEGQAFQGSIVLGAGFTMSPEDAQELIDTDPRNEEVLFPYLGGEDLNQSPTHTAPRWVINFFDWDEAKARSYPDCFSIVEERVKPERQKHGFKGWRFRSATYYWRYEGARVELARATDHQNRVIAIALTSKSVMPVLVEAGQVFSHSLGIFAYDDYGHFGWLTSGFHYRWAVRYASSMRTDTRYTPSDVFETLPQPSDLDGVVEQAQGLDAHRAQLMVAANEGLTKTYNRVHDPQDMTPDIVRLRKLHVELDYAVRDAYGWGDLDLQHGFYRVRGQGIRFTFAPDVAEEILERLLELNKQRYEAEVAAGLHSSTTAQSPARRARSRSTDEPALFDDGDDE